MSISSRENIVNFLPKCCKIAVFVLQFSDPPREVPPSAVALSVPEKNPTFSQNLVGSTDYRLYDYNNKRANELYPQ